VSGNARRAAILLSQLSTGDALRIAARLGSRQLQALRRELDGLEPGRLEPSHSREADQTLRDFLQTHAGLQRRPRHGRHATADGTSRADAAEENDLLHPRRSRPQDTAATQPTFLNGIDTDRLHGLLEDERPQTVACVLSQLTPSRAARLIRRFPPDSQQELMERVRQTTLVGGEIVAVLEGTLRQLSRELDERERSGP
jgi:flagellar motor switch protein FliG